MWEDSVSLIKLLDWAVFTKPKTKEVNIRQHEAYLHILTFMWLFYEINIYLPSQNIYTQATGSK